MNQNQDHFPALLTIKQAASFLGLNEQTLKNQLSRGTSPIPKLMSTAIDIKKNSNDSE
ncbi:MAG: hypothetical protein ACYC3N_00180 [Halothiobacillus sp.]|jgi:lambda repressor-like predicted transcriptional regulator